MSLAALSTVLLRTCLGGGGDSEGATGGEGVEAAVAVLSRLESGSGQCMQLGPPQLRCTGVGTGDGERQAAVVCFSRV